MPNTSEQRKGPGRRIVEFLTHRRQPSLSPSTISSVRPLEQNKVPEGRTNLNMREPILKADYAQEWLLNYLHGTENLLRLAVGEPFADKVKIEPAFDLCIPHDVMRLLGGFATGIYVRWDSAEPFVPVDIYMNTDVTSVFKLSPGSERAFTEQNIRSTRDWVNNKSTYLWNFENGNHFISLARSKTGETSLIMHSNEKEFKYQANGLVPTPDNWYFDQMKEVREGDRHLRYITGDKAKLFYQLTKSLEDYSVNRHRIIASRLISDHGSVLDDYHKVHYYMPSPQEAVLGVYVCQPSETVPILSYPGGPIYWFTPELGGSNSITLADGSTSLLVGHGYGKASHDPISVGVEQGHLRLNGVDFSIEPQTGLSKHPGISIRTFDDDPESPNSLFSTVKQHTPGKVVSILNQIAWYGSTGFKSIM